MIPHIFIQKKWLATYLIFCIVFFASAGHAQTITTVAGGIGDNLSAVTYGRLYQPSGVAFDGLGNYYIADAGENRIRKVNAAGIITTIAGTNSYSSTVMGAGILDPVAVYAQIGSPKAITADAAGNVYFVMNNLIGKVTSTGVFSIIAGNQITGAGFSGDGALATAAQMDNPSSVAVDGAGNVYIADLVNNRIRKINTAGIITTVAGGGSSLSDGVPATSEGLLSPAGVAIDASGNVYIAEYYTNRIRMVNTSGIISTVAGGGSSGLGDGGPATAAQLNAPIAVAVNTSGTIFIADQMNNRIRAVNSSGIISTLTTTITKPGNVSADASGNAYVATTFGGFSRIAKITPVGGVSTIAGVNLSGNGDGGPAPLAAFDALGVLSDKVGNIYVADGNGRRIRKINTSGIITTIAGTGSVGYSGDGFAATSAQINSPYGLAMDRGGNLFIAEGGHIRKVNTSGIITTVAGGGSGGLGDGGLAVAAVIHTFGVAIDTANNIYIADGYQNRIRKVTSGIITTIAGNGTARYSGDGGPATAAELNFPTGVAVDKCGNVFFAEDGHIRKIDNSGTITTIDSVPGSYNGIAADSIGNVYYTSKSSVKKADIYGYISVVAGNGTDGYMGDLGPAIAAEISGPQALALDSTGHLLIGDYNILRQVCCMSNTVKKPLFFIGGRAQSFTVCKNAAATSVDTLMTIKDGDIGDTETWSIVSAPAHGTLAGFGFTAISTGGNIKPSGMTYRPTTGYTGSDYFTVRISDGTDTSTTTVFVDVVTAPPIGVISGAPSVCSGNSTTFSNGVSGGVWISKNGHASVSPAGIVMGVTVGIDTVIYTVTMSCGSASSSRSITVTPSPTLGAITGPSSVCVGSAITLSNPATGGLWSSTSPYVTVGATSGVVIGSATGTAIVYYTYSSTCGTVTDSTVITVNSLPSAGTISGVTTSVCVSGAIALTDPVTGGIWSSGATSVATVGSTGIVTGVSAGSVFISYSVSNGCGSASALTIVGVVSSIPVNPITGLSSVCAGDTTTLYNTTPGGVWSSSNTTVATIGSTGIVTGLSAGNTVIKFTVSLGCGGAAATYPFSVDPATSAGTLSGAGSMCLGATTIISASVPGGTWSTKNGNASVNPAGLVTALSAGTDTIIYSVTNACGTALVKHGIGIFAIPNSGTISGKTTLCSGGITALSVVAPGGVWSSGSTSIATVSSAGIVSGVSVGGAVIAYSVTNGCGTATSVAFVNVVSTMPISPITGHTSVCAGDTTTLVNATPGGTWTSSNSSVATVSPTGFVTGITAGITTISYTGSAGCGSSVSAFNITVAPMVFSGTLSGPAAICASATTTLATSVAGGTWTATNSRASITPGGIITGVSIGKDTIIYTVTNACGSAATKHIIDIFPTPSAGIITGASVVCSGDSILLSDAATGGVWSSSNVSVATVGSTGLVKGIAGGVTVISYTVVTGCGTAAAAKSISVNAAAGIITGVTSLCAGGTAALSSSVSGGTWSSSTPIVAVVNSTGMVTGMAAGTAIVSYTVSAGCGLSVAYAVISVGSIPAVTGIYGTPKLCTGSTFAMSDATVGGIWSSSRPSIATIGGTGIVTGMSAGTSTISYTVSSPCGSNSAIYILEVEFTPSAGIISGSSAICAGAVATLTKIVTGGVWSSSNSAIAIVGSSGVVTGKAVGSTLINYSVTNSCGTSAATKMISVNPLPDAGAIIGPADVCIGSSVTLSDGVAGGAWSSSNTGVAAVGSGSGIVAGVTVGSATITYSFTNSCGRDEIFQVMHVNPLPDAGTISGVSNICAGSSATLTASLPTGTWSSSNMTVASAGMTTGVINGISAGTAMIIYSVTNICGTAVSTTPITVNIPDAGTITGPTTICIGNTATLTNVIAGGNWSSGATSIATVTNSGLVTGIATGISIITYSVTNACGTTATYTPFTVNALPAISPISGAIAICKGATTTLANGTLGGLWSSSNTSVATVDNTGLVTGIGKGAATISYMVTAGCGTTGVTSMMQVDTTPTAGTISGNATICEGTVSLLTEDVTGGKWSSGNIAVAAIADDGVVTGMSVGIATISYMVSNSCGSATATNDVSILSLPYPGIITGNTSICNGSTTMLENSVTGGIWNSGANNMGSVNGEGLFRATASGTTIVSYTVSNICGASSTYVPVTIHQLPYVSGITGRAKTVVGNTIWLSNEIPGGAWSSSDTTVAVINNRGIVAGVSAGTTVITYTLFNSLGCSADSTVVVTVFPKNAKGNFYSMHPNPAAYKLTIAWENQPDELAEVTIIDMTGRKVFTSNIEMLTVNGDAVLNISNIASGMYMITIRSASGYYSGKLVVL